jgi:hypothetical protein
MSGANSSASLQLQEVESKTGYKYGTPDMLPVDRVQYLKAVAGEIPIDPYQPANDYVRLSSELFEEASNYNRKNPTEDAYILFYRFLSIFRRFRYHPGYTMISADAKKEIKEKCVEAEKRLKILEELLLGKFTEEYENYMTEEEFSLIAAALSRAKDTTETEISHRTEEMVPLLEKVEQILAEREVSEHEPEQAVATHGKVCIRRKKPRAEVPQSEA